MSAAHSSKRARAWLCAAVLTGLAAGPAQAQFLSTNSAEFNGGWGRVPGSENRATDVSTKDANGNRVIVDGLILTGDDNSSFTSASGSGDAMAGVGVAGGATAIGNNLVVVTQGNYNTVIVNSTQTNNGAVTATAGGGVATGNTGTDTTGGVGNGP